MHSAGFGEGPGMEKKLVRGVLGKLLPALHPGVEIEGGDTACGSMPAWIDEIRAGLERMDGKPSFSACSHQRK